MATKSDFKAFAISNGFTASYSGGTGTFHISSTTKSAEDVTKFITQCRFKGKKQIPFTLQPAK